MRDFIAGVLGPTGPAPLVPSSPTGPKLREGVLLRGLTGTAYIGPTGYATTGAGFPLAAGAELRLSMDNPSRVIVNAPTGTMIKYIGS